jgi:hypothetical protein
LVAGDDRGESLRQDARAHRVGGAGRDGRGLDSRRGFRGQAGWQGALVEPRIRRQVARVGGHDAFEQAFVTQVDDSETGWQGPHRARPGGKEICRRTSLSRNTVRRWQREAATPKYRQREVPTKLVPFVEVLNAMLEADSHRPKAQRPTSKTRIKAREQARRQQCRLHKGKSHDRIALPRLAIPPRRCPAMP